MHAGSTRHGHKQAALHPQQAAPRSVKPARVSTVCNVARVTEHSKNSGVTTQVLERPQAEQNVEQAAAPTQAQVQQAAPAAETQSKVSAPPKEVSAAPKEPKAEVLTPAPKESRPQDAQAKDAQPKTSASASVEVESKPKQAQPFIPFAVPVETKPKSQAAQPKTPASASAEMESKPQSKSKGAVAQTQVTEAKTSAPEAKPQAAVAETKDKTESKTQVLEPEVQTQTKVVPSEQEQPADSRNRSAWGQSAEKDEGGATADAHVVLDHATPKKAEVLRNIVFVTSECAPWSKTGGLGDVMGALPKALAARGHRVMVVVPRYANYPEAFDTGKRHTVLGSEIGYFHHVRNGVDYVFVDHPSFPRPGGLYSDQYGTYGDNQFRFTLLTLAALEAPLVLPLGEQGLYGQECIFMANDWHTALVPVYLAAKYRRYGVYLGSRSILAIHNLKHQGVFSPSTYGLLDLPPDWYKCLEWQYPPHERQGAYHEEGRAVNHMKAGIVTADRVVTVSPGYADEIRTALGGCGMDWLLAGRGFVMNGIINGIDTDEWNPATDPHLQANYTIDNFVEGKAACKRALQEELALPIDPEVPLIAFIGRLDPQKGADILLQAANFFLRHERVQLVCLGTGDKALEDGMRWLESEFKDKARGWVGFNVPFSHKLTAAADILLMPSRFEPCGLNQLYAMRYGTVPVAHRTGGLKDTVIDFNPWKQEGTGWTYTQCDAEGLGWALHSALQTYWNYREDFRGIQRRGMERDASWDLAAQQYEQVMNWAAFDMPFCQ